jgi:hypothetical protein
MGSFSDLTARLGHRLVLGLVLLLRAPSAHQVAEQCPGDFSLDGHGPVSLVSTGWNTSQGFRRVDVSPAEGISTHMESRVYFAKKCTEGKYDRQQYMNLKLLNKTLRYRTDLSGAGCGCNAAFYLTSMGHNENRSECHDYYCDANNVCGESCAEIDIQEANLYAWHSTLHTAFDHAGYAAGYGGGVRNAWNGPRDWTPAEFGPGAKCVDTTMPFEVAVSFPTDGSGMLTAMVVTLSQEMRTCSISLILDRYDGMAELTKALKAGMTPIVSYWASNDMIWLDGVGRDNLGTCGRDNASACPASVQWHDFVVEDLRPEDLGKARSNVQEQFNRYPTTSTSTTTASSAKAWWQQTTTPWWATTAMPWWKKPTTTPWWASTAKPWWKHAETTTSAPAEVVVVPGTPVESKTTTSSFASATTPWWKSAVTVTTTSTVFPLLNKDRGAMHFAEKFGLGGGPVAAAKRWHWTSSGLVVGLSLLAAVSLFLAGMAFGARRARRSLAAGAAPVAPRLPPQSPSAAAGTAALAADSSSPVAAKSLAAKPSSQALLDLEAPGAGWMRRDGSLSLLSMEVGERT